jgi:hypothetical protein
MIVVVGVVIVFAFITRMQTLARTRGLDPDLA